MLRRDRQRGLARCAWGGHHETRLLMDARIALVKVFSVTKAKEREGIGEQVTAWLAANPGLRVVKAVVTLTSDEKFHCFSIVLFCAAA